MQCKALRDSAREIQSFDVAYFMASVDPVDVNAAFAAEHEANFPILSDPTKETARAYGALTGAGFASRWTFYIDADGVVARVDRNTRPATAGRDLARAMEELGFPRVR